MANVSDNSDIYRGYRIVMAENGRSVRVLHCNDTRCFDEPFDTVDRACDAVDDAIALDELLGR